MVEPTLTMPGLSEKHQIWGVNSEMVVYQRSLVGKGLGVEEYSLDWFGGRGGNGRIRGFLDRSQEAIVYPPGCTQLTSVGRDGGDVMPATPVEVITPSSPPMYCFHMACS